MEKILLVEDNVPIADGIKLSLEEEGFLLELAYDFIQGKQKISQNEYDLIMLDVTIPHGDGFELCKYIKQKSDIPVIFLTAKDEESDVVLGLDMGADDYITKPFRMRELISRIHTVLRRYRQGMDNSNIVVVEDVKLDLDKARVYKKGEEVILTALEYKILSMLFTNFGKVITREQILEKIWDIAGNFVNDNTLTVYIKRIREKIEDDMANPKILKTIRGIGYRVGD
ncbi:MAG: response regulator transcription factor [Clostridia bacterium]|jgi:DNA-binding response regulator